MYTKFYRVRLMTMRKNLTIYVDASTKEEAIGLAYLQVTNKENKLMFVKVVYVEEVRP